MVSARAGINGAPTFSPDGKKLALTLSGSNGNLDVYLLELASGQLTRLTDDPGIDTEAVFTPDGNGIYFTSDRSGSPQIYRLTPRQLRAAEARHVHGQLQCAPARLARRQTTRAADARRRRVSHRRAGPRERHGAVLSKGRQEESPSFAPNGAMLIFAGRERGQGVLQTVSVDGQTSARLDADAGEVREPVWGPFLP